MVTPKSTPTICFVGSPIGFVRDLDGEADKPKIGSARNDDRKNAPGEPQFLSHFDPSNDWQLDALAVESYGAWPRFLGSGIRAEGIVSTLSLEIRLARPAAASNEVFALSRVRDEPNAMGDDHDGIVTGAYATRVAFCKRHVKTFREQEPDGRGQEHAK